MAKDVQPRRTFFRPHKRVQYDGTLFDHRTGEFVTPPSMTKQEFKKECDINNILKQYKVTGMVSHISEKARLGTYEDLPDPLDFQESLGLVEEARRSFMTLPAKIRDRFGQDPVRFLEFVADPANAKELVELGLATAPPAPAPEPASASEAPSEPPKA